MNTVRVDFDEPAYLRSYKGMCVHSHRYCRDGVALQLNDDVQALEPVVINRLYRPQDRLQPVMPAGGVPVEGELLERTDDRGLHAVDAQTSISCAAEEDVELSFRQGMEGEFVEGIYNGSGSHWYRFNKRNGRSFYLRIGNHLVWGAELALEINRTNIQKGDKIRLTFLEKTPVTVPIRKE
ncbi:DNA primase, partial [Pseudomonas nitroreducens]